jgi:hypothetical protein
MEEESQKTISTRTQNLSLKGHTNTYKPGVRGKPAGPPNSHLVGALKLFDGYAKQVSFKFVSHLSEMFNWNPLENAWRQ